MNDIYLSKYKTIDQSYCPGSAKKLPTYLHNLHTSSHQRNSDTAKLPQKIPEDKTYSYSGKPQFHDYKSRERGPILSMKPPMGRPDKLIEDKFSSRELKNKGPTERYLDTIAHLDGLKRKPTTSELYVRQNLVETQIEAGERERVRLLHELEGERNPTRRNLIQDKLNDIDHDIRNLKRSVNPNFGIEEKIEQLIKVVKSGASPMVEQKQPQFEDLLGLGDQPPSDDQPPPDDQPPRGSEDLGLEDILGEGKMEATQETEDEFEQLVNQAAQILEENHVNMGHMNLFNELIDFVLENPEDVDFGVARQVIEKAQELHQDLIDEKVDPLEFDEELALLNGLLQRSIEEKLEEKEQVETQSRVLEQKAIETDINDIPIIPNDIRNFTPDQFEELYTDIERRIDRRKLTEEERLRVEEIVDNLDDIAGNFKKEDPTIALDLINNLSHFVEVNNDTIPWIVNSIEGDESVFDYVKAADLFQESPTSFNTLLQKAQDGRVNPSTIFPQLGLDEIEKFSRKAYLAMFLLFIENTQGNPFADEIDIFEQNAQAALEELLPLKKAGKLKPNRLRSTIFEAGKI